MTHFSEGSLLAGRFPELTPHAQDGDRVIGMVLHADMQQVVRVAVRHTCARGALSRSAPTSRPGKAGGGRDARPKGFESGNLMCASTSGVGLAVGRARTDVVVEDESSNAASGTGGMWAGQSEGVRSG